MKRAALLAAVLAGCGGQPSQTHGVRLDTGGFVLYRELEVPIAGATVTLTGADGNARTAVTSSAGAWTIENIAPGIYTERFEAAGYETSVGTWTIPLDGANDVANVFIGHDPVLLSEEPLLVELSPFGETLVAGESLVDGDGVTLVYSTSGDAAITFTFTRPVASGHPTLIDGVTGASIPSTPDASRTVFTFTESQIMSINAIVTPADPAIRHDLDPQTRHRIAFEILTYTAIHGTPIGSISTVDFDAVP